VSKGEGRERHIEVFKTNYKQSDVTCEMNSVTNNGLSTDVNITEVTWSRNMNDNDVISRPVECRISDIDGMQMSSLGEHTNGSGQSAVVTTTDVIEHVSVNNLMETAEILDETNSSVSTLCCSSCGRQIPQENYQLHSLHCKPSAAKSTSKKGKGKNSNKVTCL